ncbi:hypothetical protein X777_06865 [Ooceraea biroi]|uniref:Retrotransposon gag domain-containing protein n=1 Tax=Ooceraea biroi TaxID=2015173 RepID=A0A026WDP1_OOCBI|nr:hypothetical protein X777_06865 [Ooceraea biroi]
MAERSATEVFAETSTLLDTVQKWGCQFDDRNGVTFFERLEDLRTGYGITCQLLTCLPLLFKDQALLWYRNNQDDWRNWEDFETCFRAYYARAATLKLEEEIARRKQGAAETARNYVTAIKTLMRRHKGMPESTRLERIYHNLRPEYCCTSDERTSLRCRSY